MALLVTSFLAFLCFYFALKSFLPAWERRKLPPWSRLATGALAWLVILSLGGAVAGIALVVIEFFITPNFETAFKFVAIALGTQLIFRVSAAHPELFDVPHMKFFLVRALQFESPLLKKENVFEELDKHEVKRVYKEVTGKELKVEDVRIEDDPLSRTMTNLAKQEEENRLRESTRHKSFEKDTLRQTDEEAVKRMLRAPVHSPHLATELRELARGKTVNITDSWKINSLRKASHEFYTAVEGASINPAEKKLSLSIISEKIRHEHLYTPPILLRIKQELYEFFQFVYQQDWMKPYLRFIRHIECICSEVTDDPFAGRQTRPVLKAEITTDELIRYQNRFYNAAELPTTLLA